MYSNSLDLGYNSNRSSTSVVRGCLSEDVHMMMDTHEGPLHHQVQLRHLRTCAELKAATTYFVEIVFVGGGIHNCLALSSFTLQNPTRSSLVIEGTGTLGGVFSRLNQDYELETPFSVGAFPTLAPLLPRFDGALTCGDVVHFIEASVLRSNAHILLHNKVVKVQRVPKGHNQMGKYRLTTDSGKVVHCDHLVCGTGYESVSESHFDKATKALLASEPANIQAVDKLIWNIGRMGERYHQRRESCDSDSSFSIDAPKICVVGGGPSSEFAIFELMRVNAAPVSEIFWVRGSVEDQPVGLAIHSHRTCTSSSILGTTGYVSSITEKGGKYTINVTSPSGNTKSVLKDVDFVVLATGFTQLLPRQISHDLGGLAANFSNSRVNRLSTKEGGLENIIFLGTAVAMTNVKSLLPNTSLVCDYLRKI